MLQIKKKSTLVSCKYNLQFLFRNGKLSKKYLAKKIVSHFITLRAPKNFNIGKLKILTLNYKTSNLIININKVINVKQMIHSNKSLFLSLAKAISTNPTLLVNSIKITIQSSFKLKWLEILFSF